MDSENLDKYFSWLPVVNTVEDRLKDDSLIHTFSSRNKIRESTKKLNKCLKTARLRNYSEFKECKKKVLSNITDNVDVSDDSDLSDSDFKTFYSSFYEPSAVNTKDPHDDLFVWSYVEKKGLKIEETTDTPHDPIWEPTIDINTPDDDSQTEGKAQSNVSLKAAGALPIKNRCYQKKPKKQYQYNTRNSSSNKSTNKSINSIEELKESPEKRTEKVNSPNTEKLMIKKPKDVKRNLRSAINNVSSQVSETSEVDDGDFVPEDFQAQSTQIFSDTFTDTSVPITKRNRLTSKFLSNHTNNQPRDSGIEEDSRDENTPHQDILSESKITENDNLPSNESKTKKSLKIIGDETLKKKYRIIAKNEGMLQPIVEEKRIPLSDFNEKANGYLKHESDNDSESDFKSIETEDEKESSTGDRAKESSDEYHDVHEDSNTLTLENKVEESVVKNQSTETDVDSDSQYSKNHARKQKILKSTSPWLDKQYRDLKRLRLIDDSQEESEIYKDTFCTSAEEKVSTKSKKTSKKLTNKIEKSTESQTKKDKKKSFINGKQVTGSDLEMNNLQITDENFDDGANVEELSAKKNESSSNKTEKIIKNGNYSNSKSDSDDGECSESETADSHRSLQKNKKLKKRKKGYKSSRSNSKTSREQSYDEQIQHDLTNMVKSHKDVHSAQSIKDDDNNESIHQSPEKDDTSSNLPTEKSTEQKTESDYNNSENDSPRKDSSASSIKDHLTSKEGKENGNGSFTASDNDKESEDDKTMSEHQKKHLQQFRKMDLMASDESSDSDSERKNVEFQSKNESSSNKNERSREKITEKSYESNDDGISNLETKENLLPHKDNPSDESDKEDEVLPTQHAQKKIQQMKKLNFDDSSESENSEAETSSMNKHKSQYVNSETIKKQNSNEKSKRAHEASSGDESEEEKIKSEDEIRTSDVAHLHKKIKLQTDSKNADSNREEDSDSVHYDSDNIDVKEHKVILPKELKNSNLLDDLNESNLESSDVPPADNNIETHVDKKDTKEIENDSDEEIDNVVPVEVSKRMQQLKRLNLYEDNESSDSDESLKNSRNDKNISQRPLSILRKDDCSSDEKEEENINEEPPILPDKLDASTELNDTKEDIADEKENAEQNNNVIIPETQETEGCLSDNNRSQEMFSSLENLAECPSPIPANTQSVSKKSTPSKPPPRGKITEIAELVEQENLTKDQSEPTMTLNDISDDEEIFVIEVPKNVFDGEVIGKKLVLTKNTLTIGESHYEACKKGSSPILSCVIKSKKNKFKTVNIRPLISITARRKKNEDDFDENTAIANPITGKNQHAKKESDQESVNEFCDTRSAPTQKSKLEKRKLTQKDKLHGLSSTTLKEGSITKKKTAKNKKLDLKNFIVDEEDVEEKTAPQKGKTSKVSKRKLYVSDHEIKDIVDSNATDESFANSKKSSKKSKSAKKVTDTVETIASSAKGAIKKVPKLKNPNLENEMEANPVKSEPKAKNKKSKKKTEVLYPKTQEECTLEKVKTLEDDKEQFDRMFRDSFLMNITCTEEEKPPAKKKAKKRKIASEAKADANSETTTKKSKKSQAEDVEETPAATVKSKKSKKKDEKAKEEPASVQIMNLINDAFGINNEKLNASTSSNESRYGALDIKRVRTKRNYSSSSSSDESDKKHIRPTFCIRDKSKEKELPKPSSSRETPVKKEVKDEKKKIKKVYFDE